jgi:hypothetical protein
MHISKKEVRGCLFGIRAEMVCLIEIRGLQEKARISFIDKLIHSTADRKTVYRQSNNSAITLQRV